MARTYQFCNAKTNAFETFPEIERKNTLTLFRSLGVLGLRPLSDEEFRCIEYFATDAGPACALDDEIMTNLLSHNCAALALQSDLAFHAAMSISLRRLSLVGKKNDKVYDYYFFKTLELCQEGIQGAQDLCNIWTPIHSIKQHRHSSNQLHPEMGSNSDFKALADNGKRLHPLEIGMATFFIFAFCVMDANVVKVMGASGEVDLFSLARGHFTIVTNYQSELLGTLLEPLALHDNDREAQGLTLIRPDFVVMMFDQLFELKRAHALDCREADIYYETIELIQVMYTIAVLKQVRWPMMCVLFTHNPEFSEYCRIGKPFSRVILAFICGLMQPLVFRTSDSCHNWRNEILECYKYVPESMIRLVDYALEISDSDITMYQNR